MLGREYLNARFSNMIFHFQAAAGEKQKSNQTLDLWSIFYAAVDVWNFYNIHYPYTLTKPRFWGDTPNLTHTVIHIQLLWNTAF